MRWVTVDQLDDVDWVPADRCWLADLDRALRPARRRVNRPPATP
ncbi:hypothetical protein I551_1680 [Mycobacterium ulcerans str. Harvey]|uniref:MUTATOR PROTEIN MUTT3 n=1 Tax=Mycobacterium ulcerans str. Harvey TaxID=1299332 RepID=A0ABP3AKU4_MYCUL|nr:hypothetical protein I551_1680 [Mycobacterium ulcerans str. Harvey]